MANLSNINNKFLVTTGGNVGIGNTSPTLSTLTVGIGSTNNPSQICQLAGSGSGVYSVLSLTNTNGTAADNNGVGLDFHVNAAYSATGRIQLIHPTAQSGTTTNSSMQFLTYGTVSGVTTFSPRMTIDYIGNVGIGTTSPTSKLHLRDPGVNSDVGIKIGNDSRDWNLKVMGSISDSFQIFTHDNSNVMTILPSGNVGIGTDDPAAQLEVKADTNGKAALLLDSNALTEDAYIQYEVGGSSGWEVGMKGSGSSYGYVFSYGDIGTASNERMRIDSSGNVGITATAYLGFNGAGDASHSVGYNAGIDGAMLRGQNGVILGTGGGATATERMRITPDGGGSFAIIKAQQGTYNSIAALSLYGTNPNANGGSVVSRSSILSQTDGTAFGANLIFKVNDTSNVEQERMRIDSNGSIGMGANSSSYRLRIKTDATVTNGVYISAGTGNGNHSLYVEDRDSTAEYFAVRGDGEIRFNASSGHTYAAQGIRFGTNAAANNLDDYEEGTFYTNVTSTNVTNYSASGNNGRYTRIGRQVIVTFQYSVSAGTGQRYMVINNLPFVQHTASHDEQGYCSNYPVGQRRSGIVVNNSAGESNSWYVSWYNNSAQSNNGLRATIIYTTT